MSTELIPKKCPRCGGYCLEEHDYSTHEMFEWCNRCGYRYEYTLQKDCKGNIIYDSNKLPKYKETKIYSKGVAYFEQTDGVGVAYNYDDGSLEDIKKAFLEEINRNGINKDKCYLTYWDEKQGLISVVGEAPLEYQDDC